MICINHTFSSVFVEGLLCEDFIITYKIMLTDEDFEKYPMPDWIDQIKSRSRVDWLKNQSAIFDGKYSPEFVGMFTRFSYGMTFNMAPSDQIFTEDIAEDFAGKFKFRLRPFDDRSDLIIMNQSDYPVKGSTGLKLHFDSHPSNMWHRPNSICKPMRLLVHSPYEIPGSYDENIYCMFYHGNDLEVLITPEIVRSDESLRSYSAERRNCYFEDERKLRYFKKYTKRNCQTECFTEYLLKSNETECVEFYNIRNQHDKVCDYRYFQRLKYALQDYEFDYMEEDCNCLEDCNFIKYSIEIISSDLQAQTNNE
jgi:Amiloride-sensitive sodium channel